MAGYKDLAKGLLDEEIGRTGKLSKTKLQRQNKPFEYKSKYETPKGIDACYIYTLKKDKSEPTEEELIKLIGDHYVKTVFPGLCLVSGDITGKKGVDGKEIECSWKLSGVFMDANEGTWRECRSDRNLIIMLNNLVESMLKRRVLMPNELLVNILSSFDETVKIKTPKGGTMAVSRASDILKVNSKWIADYNNANVEKFGRFGFFGSVFGRLLLSTENLSESAKMFNKMDYDFISTCDLNEDLSVYFK